MTALLLIASLIAAEAESPKPAMDPRAVEALQRFARVFQDTKTLTYRLKKRERLRSGVVRDEQIFTKFRKPGSVYLKAEKPKAGQEVIYRPDKNPTQIVVHQGSFPDVTVTIDLEGALATENQRHLVTHTGFTYTLENLLAGLARADREPMGESMSFAEIPLGAKKGYIVTLLSGERKDRRVQAKAGETLFAFAKRVGQDPYIIFVANPSIDEDDYTDELEAGQSYVVPAYYAYKTELVFDAETGFLVRQSCFDKSGTSFERFEYEELVINPALTDKDFDPDNPAYDF